MRKKEIIAMLLAGGQGSRLGVLTKNKAKPAVHFGGKYRIIDFPLSNCINSGVDTVGVLTQYRPLQLNSHIGIGLPWDLDRRNGGVSMLSPHVKGETGEWYSGTANAIFQNMQYINNNNPEYVLILSGDHIYKMDYAKMLEYHKERGADATIAVLEVSYEEASRFGIMNANEDDSIYEFEEKPANPKSNLASMGIYIFTWDVLKEYLIRADALHDDTDFGKHIIPMMLGDGKKLFAHHFNGYWKDVGTIESYWQANMELIKALPEFNLYEDFWKIYTNSAHQPPQYTGDEAMIKTSLLSEGCEVYGEVYNSILSPNVVVGKGTIIRDSIIMSDTVIGENCVIDRCVIDEDNVIGNNVTMGNGESIANKGKPNIYNTGITVTGEMTVIPDNVSIGKNCVIFGDTKFEQYPEGRLESGDSIVLEEEVIS